MKKKQANTTECETSIERKKLSSGNKAEKTLAETHSAENFLKEIASPPQPQTNTHARKQTLFTRQMKQYAATMPI